MTHKVFATVCALGLLASGCASHDETDQGGVYGARQEGNLDASPQRDVQQPYSPVLGDTTGDGLPKDRRNGGGITGSDVTPSEKVNQTDKTRSNDGSSTTGGGTVVTPR